MGKLGTAALLAFILLVPPVFAQSTTAQTAPAPSAPLTKSEAPTVITDVEEVTLDLVVHNKKNKPVLDLKPEDIAVMDNGSAVKLSDLRLVTGASLSGHSVTLVFDRLAPSAAKNARDIATKILKMAPANGFSFSVLNIGGRLRLFQEFTSDRVPLGTAIGAATESAEGRQDSAPTQGGSAWAEKNLIVTAQTGTDSSGTRVSTKDRNAARIMLASLQESQRIVQDQHCLASLAGLLALARNQRQIEGRKAIIFFEQGTQLDSNAKDMLPSIVGAANRSGVSIYAVDANPVDEQAGQGLLAAMAIGGVSATNRMNPASPTTGTGTALSGVPTAPPGSIVAGADSMDRIEMEGLSGYKNPMAELAGKTGGAYITASDRLNKPLQQLIEDMTTFYEASYVPPVQELDGTFRPVAVKPVRTGIKIRSRAGYFALPPGPGGMTRPFEAPLMKLLGESQYPTDLKFHSAVLRLGELPEGNENVLVVAVPTAELETRDDPNSNLYSLHVSIVAQIKNKSGEVIEHFSEDIPRHAALDSKQSVDFEWLTMQRHFLADPGEYIVEAAVLDRNSEKAGAERMAFEIPSESAGPSLSDVTVVQRMEPLPAETDSTEPLRYGTSKVVPSLSGQLPHGAKNISFFFVVHPDPNSTELPRLEMAVLKNGEQIAQLLLPFRKTTGAVSVPYLASIQSSSLSSGSYEVIERLVQDGKTVEHAAAFSIEGLELASGAAPANSSVRQSADTAPISTAPELPLAGSDGHSGRHIVITTLPEGAVSAPSPDQLEAMVAGARKRALEYTTKLPNFICVELTNRSVDQSGKGNWKHRDSLAELLTYHDNHESRSTLQVNGRRSTVERADLNSTWPISLGEFGALLKLVFAPSSKTAFQWKEAATLGDGSGAVQVLSYRVSPENATLSLKGNESIAVGFHGLVYIDGATGGIRRVTVEADGLPRNFSMHAAAMTVDYDYVAISGRDYLMPVLSTVSLQRGRKQVELNEITFRNYRRFASRTKIKMIQ